MAFDITPGNLWREVQGALQWQREHLKTYDRQLQEYHGRHYKGYQGGGQDRIEGVSFSWMAQVLGRLTYSNPRVKVSTRRPADQGLDAQLLHHGLNRWIKDHDFQRSFEPIVRDAQFNFGVALITSEPVPGMTPLEYVGGVDGGQRTGKKGVPHAPSMYRLSQRWYVEDPKALDRKGLRFQGHFWVRDKSDLLKEAKDHPDRGWNAALIEGLGTDMDGDITQNEVPAMGGEGVDVPPRKQVFGVDIWVPDRQLEGKSTKDGYHGSLYTIAIDPTTEAINDSDKDIVFPADGGEFKAEYLREPRPWYGPSTGPYAVLEIYSVPDDPTPLGALTATQEQQDRLQDVSAANTRSAERYKRLILVEEGGDADKKLHQRIKSSPHDYVYGVQGLAQSGIVQAELGGITDQAMLQEARMREKVERTLGITDAMRGEVSGKGTASENIIAAQNSATRLDFVEMKVYRFAKECLSKVAEFMWMDNRIVFPLGPKVAEELGMEPVPALDDNGWPVLDERGQLVMIERQPMFRGGPSDAAKETSFSDLEVEIEPYSMQRTDEGSERQNMLMAVQMLMQAAPMVRQFPEVPWRDVFDSLTESLNLPNLFESYDLDMAQQIGAALMQMQLQAGQTPSAEQTPKFEGYTKLQGAGGLPGVNVSAGGGRAAPQQASSGSAPEPTTASAVR